MIVNKNKIVMFVFLAFKKKYCYNAWRLAA